MNLCYRDFIKRQSVENTSAIDPIIANSVFNDKTRALFGHFPFAYYILNYSTLGFEIFNNSEKIVGYSKDDFMLGGLRFSLKKIHPDDFLVFSEKLFPEILNFFSSIPNKACSDYTVSYNYRFMQKDKSSIHVQIHSTFIDFNQYHLPARNFSIITNISSCKKDTSINLNIAKNTNEKETVILYKKFQQGNPSLLSDREKEILKLAIKGQTSKEIGNKLFISINTVRNHKQNMMEKTNSPNIVSLIDYYLANEKE